MSQDWLWQSWLYAYAFVSTGMSIYRNLAQDVIVLRMLLFQLERGIEAIDKRRQSTSTVSMRQEVQRLNALWRSAAFETHDSTHYWLCEVCGIGMRLQSLSCVSSVLRRQIRSEVVKGTCDVRAWSLSKRDQFTVMGVSDRSDQVDHILCRFRSRRHTIHERKSILFLSSQYEHG